MKKIIFAMCAVACLSACTPECPDKNVTTTKKMVCISKKDTTNVITDEHPGKWHIRDGKVYECHKGKDIETDFIYTDGKFVKEDDKFFFYCE